jgi:lipopolysaccharide/colanic/teichoic acid biosynthesis glycosyltransferase
MSDEATSQPVVDATYAIQWQDRTYEVVKRIQDISVALIVLILFFPLWVLLAAIVRLTSPGSAFYCQRRVMGKGGREFTAYKFRTMYDNSDVGLHKHAIARFLDGQPLSVVEKNGEQVPVYKLTEDPRVTSFGKILRKTGLDEVPQFINVLRGEMSIVGPRPPLHYEYELYTERQKLRLGVLPGITGLYQVTARSQVTFEEMVAIDMEYIKRRSFWLDLTIMLKTPWVMITGKGAH